MKKKPTYIFGIDTSKEQLDFCLLNGLEKTDQKVVKKKPAAIKRWLLKILKQYKIQLADCQFCIEQTGIYCNHLISVLLELDAMFSVENTTGIKLSGGITRGKDDKVDAYRIAKYAYRYADSLSTYQPKRVIVCQLDELDKLRQKLIVQRKINHRKRGYASNFGSS